jgi:hypothetical protein
MYTTVPIRLASRRNLDKSDVEQVYGTLVQTVGGTYYAAGVPSTVNGSLDYRNFAPNAGITNQYKANPYGVFPLQLTTAQFNNTVSNYYITMPWDYAGIQPFSGTVVGWSVSYMSAAGTASTTWRFGIMKAGSLSVIDSVTKNLVVLGDNVGYRAISYPFNSRDVYVFRYEGTNAALVVAACAWVKSLHVK